jgi:hypothetical protein
MFIPLVEFYCPFGDIKILGISFGSTSFVFYLQEALGEDD